MSIRRLPPELVNRIAAGEVVERPASALKELVENALDAGATQVAVRLSAGGLELIEVTDDGSGMSPEEMRLALERHATSKLPEDAIDRITSFGFRGEALPSIASVVAADARKPGARRRRLADRDRSWRHGGRGAGGASAGHPNRVEGLFDKVPARRKFLRSPRAEYAACLDAVKRLAMARSDVGFTLDHDGRRILTLQPSDAPARVAAMLSHELDRHGVGIDCTRDGVRLTGVISLPTFNRGVADQQYPVRQLAAGEGPVVGRGPPRRLSRPHRPRPPSDRGVVPRRPARGCRRQRPPGQDRGPLPRSVGGARPDRRRPAPRARRGRPAQRRARAGGGAGDVDDSDTQADRHPRESGDPAAMPKASRVPAFAGVTDVAKRELVRPRPRRPRRAGDRAGPELPARRRPRAGRRDLHRRRGRGRAGDRRPARRARAAGARTHARARGKVARSPARRC